MILRWARAHPLVVTALATAVSVATAAWFIWNHRGPGTYDPDELGYLATALRFHRNIDPTNPQLLFGQVTSTTLGPLVPLLSSGLLVAGPRDPRTALLIQPILVVVLAVAVAGMTKRFTSPLWAILAGAYVAAMPTVLMASQSYWYGLAASTFAACAAWALLASERLTNWRWLLFGVLLGLMLLTRTMTLGFAPGFLAAALFLAWGDRRALLRLGGAALAALATAGWWWWSARDDIFQYLVGYGYGPEAAEWGSGGVLDRLAFRGDRMVEAIGMPWWLTVVAVVAVVVAGVGMLQRVADDRRWTSRRREAAALLVVGIAGLAALASTTNQGLWFELPVVVVLVPVGVAVLARAPKPLAVAVAAWMVVGVVALPVAHRVVRQEQHATGPFALSDPRFASSSESVRQQATDDWAGVAEELYREVSDITEQGKRGVVYVTGNTFLLNSNTLEFLAEVDGHPMGVRVPQTYGRTTFRDDELSPLVPEYDGVGDPLERMVVVVRHDFPLFTPDFEWEAYEDALRDRGWATVARLPLPTGGGDVVVLRHPDGRAEPR